MCYFCEGKAVLKATNHGEGWGPEEMYFGENGPILSVLTQTGWKTIKEVEDAGSSHCVDYAREAAEKMKVLKANIYVPSSEGDAFFHFKFCPECGKPLEKL